MKIAIVGLGLIGGSLGMALKKDNNNLEIIGIDIAEEIEAPVKADTKVGKVSFVYEGATVDEFDILASENVEKITFGSVFSFLMGKLFEF